MLLRCNYRSPSEITPPRARLAEHIYWIVIKAARQSTKGNWYKAGIFACQCCQMHVISGAHQSWYRAFFIDTFCLMKQITLIDKPHLIVNAVDDSDIKWAVNLFNVIWVLQTRWYRSFSLKPLRVYARKIHHAGITFGKALFHRHCWALT